MKFTDEQIQATSVNKTCDCGRHTGKGQATAREQAQIFNWFRYYKRPEWFRNEGGMADYLKSYEQTHGMLGATEFIYNASRWKDFPSVQKVLNGGKLDW